MPLPPLLHKILSNWPKEPERPPLLLNGLKESDWELLRDDLIGMFIDSSHIARYTAMKSGHPDVLVLERDPKKTGIEVKQTREFIGQLALSSYELPLKLGIIPMAHELNIQSQNALLKTLEEPLKNRYLILGTISKNKLLPTILSRSTIINLPAGTQRAVFLQDEILNLYKQCLESSLPKRLQKGQEWSQGNTEKIIEFFETIILHLQKKLQRNVIDGNIKNTRLLTEQLGRALDYSEQLQKTSGANPKLLFESFLLNMG